MIKFCSLFSGSSGNCIYVNVNGTKILFDAGLSGIRIRKALESIGVEPAEVSAIFVTHEHSDHIHGVGVLSRRYDIPVYANMRTWEQMKQMIGDVDSQNVRFFSTGEIVELGEGVQITSFATPHDAAESVGFNVTDGAKRISIATDIGHMTDSILSALRGSDLVLLESNHDLRMLQVGPYPYPLKRRIQGDYGHLSNDMAGKTAAYLVNNGTRKLILGHLSHENNYPELALLTTKNILEAESAEVCIDDLFLEIARRDCVSKVVEI